MLLFVDRTATSMERDRRRSKAMKAGYLYVLVHPSDPTLYKVGVTVLHPQRRLSQHNREYRKYAGKIVKDTGQNWKLKTYISVPDPYWAERAFWGATHVPDIPYRRGIEIEKMDWTLVQRGLEAAQMAGLRRGLLRKPVARNAEWMRNELDGTGIVLIGKYRGLIASSEFQCEVGHVFKESSGLVANRKSCPCCVDWKWLRGPRAGLRISL